MRGLDEGFDDGSEWIGFLKWAWSSRSSLTGVCIVGGLGSLGMVFPLTPGFPLGLGRFVIGPVVGLVVVIVRLILMLMFPRCRLEGSWLVVWSITRVIIITAM